MFIVTPISECPILGIHPGFCLVAAVGVAANVRRNVWHLKAEDFIVAVNGVVKTVLPMHGHFRHPVFVSEEKARVSTHHLLRQIRWPVLKDAAEHIHPRVARLYLRLDFDTIV